MRLWREGMMTHLFSEEFKRMAERVHLCARKHGFWSGKLARRSDGELIALMHSELSECLEALRHGNPPDEHIPEFNNATVELADLVIRAMDMAAKREWPLGAAIVAKAQFNESRPMRHGKKF